MTVLGLTPCKGLGMFGCSRSSGLVNNSGGSSVVWSKDLFDSWVLVVNEILPVVHVDVIWNIVYKQFFEFAHCLSS